MNLYCKVMFVVVKCNLLRVDMSNPSWCIRNFVISFSRLQISSLFFGGVGGCLIIDLCSARLLTFLLVV